MIGAVEVTTGNGNVHVASGTDGSRGGGEDGLIGNRTSRCAVRTAHHTTRSNEVAGGTGQREVDQRAIVTLAARIGEDRDGTVVAACLALVEIVIGQ